MLISWEDPACLFQQPHSGKKNKKRHNICQIWVRLTLPVHPALNIRSTAHYCGLIGSNSLITTVSLLWGFLAANGGSYLLGLMSHTLEKIWRHWSAAVTVLRDRHHKLQGNYHPKIYCIIQSPLFEVKYHTFTCAPLGISARHSHQGDRELGCSTLPTEKDGLIIRYVAERRARKERGMRFTVKWTEGVGARHTGSTSASSTVAVQMTCRWGWCTVF